MFCNLALPQRKIITLSEIFRFQNRIELPSSRDISLKLLLAGAYPGVVMLPNVSRRRRVTALP